MQCKSIKLVLKLMNQLRSQKCKVSKFQQIFPRSAWLVTRPHSQRLAVYEPYRTHKVAEISETLSFAITQLI